MTARIIRRLLLVMTHICVGAHGRFSAPLDAGGGPRVFFANHTSHMDTLTVLAALPDGISKGSSPAAAKEYWEASALRRFLAVRCLNAVLVDRLHPGRDPLAPLLAALASGRSLLIFPEGTRGSAAEPAPFKSGLYYLAKKMPETDFVPVYLDNALRSMGKGDRVPLPVLTIPVFGPPLRLLPGEGKAPFLERARVSLCDLIPLRLRADSPAVTGNGGGLHV